MFEFVIESKEINDERVICNCAAQLADISFLRSLIEQHKMKYNKENIASYAVFGGNLEMLKYVIEKCDAELNENVLEYACKSGNMDMIRWIHEIKGKMNDKIMRRK